MSDAKDPLWVTVPGLRIRINWFGLVYVVVALVIAGQADLLAEAVWVLGVPFGLICGVLTGKRAYSDREP